MGRKGWGDLRTYEPTCRVFVGPEAFCSVSSGRVASLCPMGVSFGVQRYDPKVIPTKRCVQGRPKIDG